ncbi:uncharacterized protein SRS1_15148 [Sporisorium reilianum f. sp. reilianum]|uniref:Uncharacterized protein n=1 Tax=Sporisorium reilianum f. sp. reilianum TaxID=72559 RepID=A0A2N8UIC3_9BASI|nr:uncharacterized protein SRS1_15148 [Sporisorium reilianum f. sp. reilianum]
MPRPLKFVVRIITNHGNKKVGTPAYRIMEVNVGDGKRTKLITMFGSVLYQISDQYNPLPEGSYAVLYDVEDFNRGGKPALRFKLKSSVARLTDFDADKWLDVIRWHEQMNERAKARQMLLTRC